MRIAIGIIGGAILGLAFGYIFGFVALFALFTVPAIGPFLENSQILIRVIFIPLGSWLGYYIMKRLNEKGL